MEQCNCLMRLTPYRTPSSQQIFLPRIWTRCRIGGQSIAVAIAAASFSSVNSLLGIGGCLPDGNFGKLQGGLTEAIDRLAHEYLS
jgi:hypothetical protein